MLGNERTLKTGLTLTRNGNFNPDEVAGAGFYQFTVAEVAAEVRYRGVALMIELNGHLDFERVVKYGFGDLLEQAVFADDLSGGLIAGDELLNKFLTGKAELGLLLLLCGHVRLLGKLGSLAKCSSTKKTPTLCNLNTTPRSIVPNCVITRLFCVLSHALCVWFACAVQWLRFTVVLLTRGFYGAPMTDPPH